jgi:potassium channel subfamily K member 1
LEAFIARIVAANSRGISAIENLTVEPNWSYGQAVFFSGTVLTTIGYGHVSPLSPSGKVFCILYALFGIPMTLILISACVERLLILTNKLYDSMKQTRVFANSLNVVNLQLLTYTHLAMVFFIVFIAFFIIPAAIFSSVEKDWDYLDALYYCFISLTTIGLGRLYSILLDFCLIVFFF